MVVSVDVENVVALIDGGVQERVVLNIVFGKHICSPHFFGDGLQFTHLQSGRSDINLTAEVAIFKFGIHHFHSRPHIHRQAAFEDRELHVEQGSTLERMFHGFGKLLAADGYGSGFTGFALIHIFDSHFRIQ